MNRQITKELFSAEFLARCFARKTALSKDDCPDDYHFEEYKEGWMAAFSFAESVFAGLMNEVGDIVKEEGEGNTED